MFAPLVFGLSGSRQILSLVVRSYNYSQLVFLWVVGMKQQILISVSGFPVNFNFQTNPPPPPTYLIWYNPRQKDYWFLSPNVSG